MQYSTYLLLIGAATATGCINTAITEASAANAEKMGNWTTELAKNTPEVEAFAIELKEAQDHVNEMIIEDKLAKIGKVQEEMTKADTNLTTAQTLLDQLIAKDGNAALNKILIDIETATEEKVAAELAYKTAINMCVPDTHQEYLDEQLAAHKTEKGYDAMSAEDQASFDERAEKMLAAKNEKTANLRMAADYQDMSQAEKDMFDKLLLAQWKVEKDQRAEMDDKVNRQGMTKEAFEALTDEEKAAAMEKMQDMREMFDQKRDGRDMSNMELKKQAGYFTTMTKEQKTLFDQKLSERNTRQEGDLGRMFDKFEEAKGKMGDMTDEQKKKFMSEGIDMIKMKASREQKFDDHDFSQRIKMGFFTKMNEGERGQFDDKQKKLRDERQGDFSKMDDKLEEIKQSSQFQEMSDEDKKNFLAMFMMQMGSNMQQMKKDREDDDDLRKRMGYFKQDQAGRDNADKQVQYQQGKRTESRMQDIVMLGESKSTCYPSQYYDNERGYMGGKDGQRNEPNDDMIGGMLKEGMKDGDSEGMMKDGMHGPSKAMFDKMNGMEGVLDKMGQMSKRDQLQIKERLQGMKDGNSTDQMKGGIDGMKEGIQGMMQQKFNSMMRPDGKEDMMSKMGGKEGMMNLMGMTKGIDKDGNDMKQKFEGKMQQRQGQSSGPMSQEDFMNKRDEMKGNNKSFNGGCAENLCCGHVLSFGVWGEEYFCYDQYSITVDEGNRFKCVEGLARNMAAGAATLLAAAFMMQ